MKVSHLYSFLELPSMCWMGCCPLHESLNKTNKIFIIHSIECWFLTQHDIILSVAQTREWVSYLTPPLSPKCDQPLNPVTSIFPTWKPPASHCPPRGASRHFISHVPFFNCNFFRIKTISFCIQLSHSVDNFSCVEGEKYT